MIRYFAARGETSKLTPAARRHLRGSYIQLSDGMTHYELRGPEGGELVLLMPGLTVPLFYWDKFAARLHAQGLRTLAYSAYGRGYSDRAVAEYDRPLFLRQARELIERLGVGDIAHLVGTSMGALNAMALVHESWFRTRTITLVGPAGLESSLPLIARIARWSSRLAEILGRRRGYAGVTAHLDRNVMASEHVRELQDLLRGPLSYEGSIYTVVSTLASFPLVKQQELYRSTGALGLPILLLWGSEDRVTPANALETARALLKPEQCHVIPNCGHMAPFEQPDAVAAHFQGFIRTRRS